MAGSKETRNPMKTLIFLTQCVVVAAHSKAVIQQARIERQ